MRNKSQVLELIAFVEKNDLLRNRYSVPKRI